MKLRPRTVVLVLLSCVAAGLVAAFVWLPWNPFEADAGPLDAWVPADVEAVVRFDARAVREADAVRTLWDGPAGRRPRDDFGLDAKLEDVRRIDAELAALPLAGDDPPTVERDFLGREVLVALRGDDVLAMTRISGRAKAIDLIRRAGDARRAKWGLRVEGDGYAATVGGRDIRFARRRDVLIISTSKDMIESALTLASGGGDSIVADADYRAARPAAPSGAKIGAWAAGRLLARHVKLPPVFEKMLAPAFAHGVGVELDLSKPDVVGASCRFARGGADLVDVGYVAQYAQTLAWPDEVFAVGAFPVSAHDAVAALFDSQPDARRKLVEELLVESGSSIDAVVTDLSRHFAPGVGFVVARLPETDRLKLDDADGDPVEPIPATVAVFRLADADAEPFLADLRRHAADLFGQDARLVESVERGGKRWFVADAASLGREWAMLRPAVTIHGMVVVFSTNEGYLRREHEEGITSWATPPPRVAESILVVANLAKRLDDLRWEAADRATWRDWAAERRALRKELERRRPAPTPAEIERREDEEIARRMEDRKRRLFPRAVRAYRDSLRWLDAVRFAGARATVEGDAVRIDATISLSAR